MRISNSLFTKLIIFSFFGIKSQLISALERSWIGLDVDSFKVSFEVNGLQIFGDFRHVFGSEEELPVPDLKGFSYNIGFSFNTEVFGF